MRNAVRKTRSRSSRAPEDRATTAAFGGSGGSSRPSPPLDAAPIGRARSRSSLIAGEEVACLLKVPADGGRVAVRSDERAGHGGGLALDQGQQPRQPAWAARAVGCEQARVLVGGLDAQALAVVVHGVSSVSVSTPHDVKRVTPRS